MIDDELKSEILRSITFSGETEHPTVVPIISRNSLELVDRRKGLPRIKYNLAPKFSLILGQPFALQALSPLEIRCCLCHKIISYPCWYWTQQFAINHMHYFICFDSHSPGKVTAKCFRS